MGGRWVCGVLEVLWSGVEVVVVRWEERSGLARLLSYFLLFFWRKEGMDDRLY